MLPLLFLIRVYHPLQAEVIYPNSASERRGRKEIKIRRMLPALGRQRRADTSAERGRARGPQGDEVGTRPGCGMWGALVSRRLRHTQLGAGGGAERTEGELPRRPENNCVSPQVDWT